MDCPYKNNHFIEHWFVTNFLCHTFIILCVRWWDGGREFDPKCNLSIVISTKLSWRIQDTTDND